MSSPNQAPAQAGNSCAPFGPTTLVKLMVAHQKIGRAMKNTGSKTRGRFELRSKAVGLTPRNLVMHSTKRLHKCGRADRCSVKSFTAMHQHIKARLQSGRNSRDGIHKISVPQLLAAHVNIFYLACRRIRVCRCVFTANTAHNKPNPWIPFPKRCTLHLRPVC